MMTLFVEKKLSVGKEDEIGVCCCANMEMEKE